MTSAIPSPNAAKKTGGRKAGAAVAITLGMLLGSAGAVAAQTDQTEPTQEDQTDRSERRQRRTERRAQIGTLIADTIGITLEDLRSEFQDGKSVAEVAEENGVDTDTVVDALITRLEERLDTAVENGRLTEEEAAERLERRSERVAERVERAPGERRRSAND